MPVRATRFFIENNLALVLKSHLCAAEFKLYWAVSYTVFTSDGCTPKQIGMLAAAHVGSEFLPLVVGHELCIDEVVTLAKKLIVGKLSSPRRFSHLNKTVGNGAQMSTVVVHFG